MWNNSADKNKNVQAITKELFAETALKYLICIILLKLYKTLVLLALHSLSLIFKQTLQRSGFVLQILQMRK